MSYGALHSWLRRHFPLAGACAHCGKKGRTEYASITNHVYVRPMTERELRENYVEVCRGCHLKMDGHPRQRRNLVQ